MADSPSSEQQAADKAAAEKAAAEKAAAAAKAAAEKAAAAWKKKSYAEIAAEHVRLKKAGLHDAAAEFHDKFVKTYEDK